MDRFVLIIDGLCRAVAARHRAGLPGPLILLIWGRLRRLAARFVATAARGPGAVVRRTAPRAARVRPAPAALRLPRGFAWLIRLVPEAAGYGGQWEYLLSDPEMVALLEAAPRMHRMVRPLCRMLGVAAPLPVADKVRHFTVAHEKVADEAVPLDGRWSAGPAEVGAEAPAPDGQEAARVAPA